MIGEATAEQRLELTDPLFNNQPIAMPLEILLGKPPKMERRVTTVPAVEAVFNRATVKLADALEWVLAAPTVASKSFLITIGDRSVTGLVARDQMVGPWQVPVADCGVTATDYHHYSGEAMAIGERPPVALLNPAASARLAVGEALTNLLAADLVGLHRVVLSANWMAAAGHVGEDAALYQAVQAIGLKLCPELGITIPVGKDSLSMKSRWHDRDGQAHQVTAPLSLLISAFAPVTDIRRTLTPLLDRHADPELLLIDLGQGLNRLGGSVLAQVYNSLGSTAPDLDSVPLFKQFVAAVTELRQQQLIVAYHDRSDGGVIVTLLEMAFASHCGLTITLPPQWPLLDGLFSEELGVVIQLAAGARGAVEALLERHGLTSHIYTIAKIADDDAVTIYQRQQQHYRNSRIALQRRWSETSFRMQALRDNRELAQQEFDTLLDSGDPGLTAHLTFTPTATAPALLTGLRPRVAILREQGVNGQMEMAAAWDRAGFTAVDLHMSDLLSGRVALESFQALAACGGFSYGDVLGAGEGWAKSILFHSRTRDQFAAFFSRPDTLSLGVCNGCQMLSNLHELIPGSELWPHFVRNRSEQFEARLSLVEVAPSPSLLLREMVGSYLPIVVAHGEGRAEFNRGSVAAVEQAGLVALRYLDHTCQPTDRYPFNPNGSPNGITGLTTTDGRVTILMPHPERLFRTVQQSWHPAEWGETGAWLQLFQSARRQFA